MRLAVLALTLVLLVSDARTKPKEPPPAAGGALWPAPAWLAVGGRAAWLPHGSFCWKGRCADFAHPGDRDDVPAFVVRPGTKATIHLGFAPRRVTVTLYRGGAWNAPTVLRPRKRTCTWPLKTTGLVQISAFSRHGVASYLARVTVRR